MKTTLMALSRVNSLLMLLMILLAGGVVGCDDEEDNNEDIEWMDDIITSSYGSNLPDTIICSSLRTEPTYASFTISEANSNNYIGLINNSDFRLQTNDWSWIHYEVWGRDKYHTGNGNDDKMNYYGSENYVIKVFCDNYFDLKSRQGSITLYHKDTPIDSIIIIQKPSIKISILENNSTSWNEAQNEVIYKENIYREYTWEELQNKTVTFNTDYHAKDTVIARIEYILPCNQYHRWKLDIEGDEGISYNSWCNEIYDLDKLEDIRKETVEVKLQLETNADKEKKLNSLKLRLFSNRDNGGMNFSEVGAIKINIQQDGFDRIQYGDPVTGAVVKPIDLGLSVLWADRNIGAYNEGGNGAYFRFGESVNCWTSGEDSESNYSFITTPTKKEVNKVVEELCGKGWRLPTIREFQELSINTNATILQYAEYMFYDKDLEWGPAQDSCRIISFLINSEKETYYWTSNIDYDGNNIGVAACGAYYFSTIKTIPPYWGAQIRPVKARE